jgi:hypothetical protein
MKNIYKGTVAVPLAEYEELLRESEKMECIKRFYGDCEPEVDDSVVLETILSIIDLEEEVE